MPIVPMKFARTEQMMKLDRQMFSASSDSLVMKQILASHDPHCRELQVEPILYIIEEIMHHVSPGIVGVINGVNHVESDASLEEIAADAFDVLIREGLSTVIHKISSELSCKCSGSGDAHAATMGILNMLSIYSWDSKLIISLASFAVNYGEFWLLPKMFTSNQLAKSIAILKQLPDSIEHSNGLKSRLDAINNIIKAMLDVTKTIVEFKRLPSHYIPNDAPPMAGALSHIPGAVYWTVRSMFACASFCTSILGLNYEIPSCEMSSLADWLSSKHGDLRTQLASCYQYADENRNAKYFQLLIKVFEIPHEENSVTLRALMRIKGPHTKNSSPPLLHCSTKTPKNVDVLGGKTVMLLISDLDLSQEELSVLTHIYQEARSRHELNYEIVWLPVVDISVPWNETHEQKFKQLQSKMLWYTVNHPSLLEPAVIKYIKEVWHFKKELMLVVLDPKGKMVCPNSLHMVYIWGNLAYPFTQMTEESLWKEETWRLELLVDGIDPSILDWIHKEKFICLYGGEDIEWIRRFTTVARSVASQAGIQLEMIYVGKSSSRKRVKNINDVITAEKLSHCWNDLTNVWYFWTRVGSMLNITAIQNVKLMQEVLAILTFDGSVHGWALISRGSAEMARNTGDIMLTSLIEFQSWENDAKEKGFVRALNECLHGLQSPLHNNRLILPGSLGGIPEPVQCAECGRPMEKYSMYCCCNG